jgi:hypothetical protein
VRNDLSALRGVVRRHPRLDRALLPLRERVRRRVKALQWRLGRQPYPPTATKHQLILEVAASRNLRALVETGTYIGETVDAMRRRFDRVTSIELADQLYARAKARFPDVANVHLLHGDSAELLPDVLQTLDVPALFWLDSHPSTDGTARGPDLVPVIRELEAVLRHRVRTHVALLDDAHLFTGRDGWPTLDDVTAVVQRERPDLSVTVRDDVIVVG